MPRISYQYDLNDPESRDKARRNAYLQYFVTLILGGGTILGIFVFIINIISLFEKGFTSNYFSSVAFLFVIAVLDFLAIFWKIGVKAMLKQMKYFLFCIVGIIVELSCIGNIVFTINMLKNGDGRIISLALSVFGAVFSLVVIWIGYNKMKGRMF